MKIGIPYFECVVVDGRVYRKCPVCGQLVRQSTNNAPAKHWERAGHKEGGGDATV